MSTYNDNLHSSVVASLNAQETHLIQMKSQLDAAMFSLYYAEGAMFTAKKNLEESNIKYKEEEDIKLESVNVSDISTSLLTTAQNENAFVQKSISNSAVAAANVQIASNAIVKLASDVGAILSIVNAADYGTDIYEQSVYANKLMDRTAYLAEQTSRSSMEASQLTAEVSAAAVENQATATNSSITSLLEKATADLEETAALQATNNEVYEQESAEEKKAEGALEDINVDYFATLASYNFSNRELNLDLKVNTGPFLKIITPPKDRLIPLDDEIIPLGKSYVVSFNHYKAAFNISEEIDTKYVSSAPSGYPVDEYYIMLVKNSNKSQFGLSNAENLLLYEKSEKRYLPVSPTDGKHKAVKEVYMSELYDSDGEEMELGEEYVVFVLAVLSDKYKKEINNFDDYLTAPSQSFKLTNHLQRVEADTISVQERLVDVELDLEVQEKKILVEDTKEQYLCFDVSENPDYNVEYRCMFLPINNSIKGLLTAPGLRRLEREIKELERIAEKHDPGINESKKEVNTLESTVASIKKVIQKNSRKLIKLEASSQDHIDATANIKENKAELAKKNQELRVAKKKLQRKEAMKEKELLRLVRPSKSKLGFFFNKTIAEQVSYANYYLATKKGEEKDSSDEISGEITDKDGNIKVKVKESKKGGKKKKLLPLDPATGFRPESYELVIRPEMTDNFGNILSNGKKYIPVILSYSAENEDVRFQFTNALSNYDNTDYFEYIREETNIVVSI